MCVFRQACHQLLREFLMIFVKLSSVKYEVSEGILGLKIVSNESLRVLRIPLEIALEIVKT